MSSDEFNVSDKVDILSTEDERLKIIGEILSSDSSRKILQLLFNQSFTANQIAQKTGMSLQLVIHHLKKMQSARVVKITNVGKNTKSHDMKYYTIDKVALVILPSKMSQSAKKSKSLFNSFNRIHRLATLGGVSIAAWFSSQFLQNTSNVIHTDQTESKDTTLPPEQMASKSPMISEKAPTDSPEFSDTTDVPSFSDMPSEGPTPLYPETVSSPTPTGEPSIDLFWSAIIVLGIIVIGLAIEIAIKSSNAKKQIQPNS
ncbi:winged helix-turn-helix domain-containing protein [Nitrosopumilus sp.]|uniref:ArsR/SmtB family transcription factor n=1 Tax=Nitrosopumilus sp. TaxID=2024843 RepID=UPI00292FB8A0|nr:winged helix-turn-helix domain-containing protein [Nitrosopumilus sp.]